MARRVGEVLGFERDGTKETVKVDPGGKANQTAEHFSPSGVDAPPLPGDYAALEDGAGKGGAQVVGYYDDKNTRLAQGGEYRVYGRDAAGNVVNSFWLKRDGTVVTQNAGGTQTMTPAGGVRSTFTDVELIDGAGQAVARVGDLVSVVIPALVVVDPGGPGTWPVAPGAGLPLAAAGQIVSGRNALKG